LVKKSDSLLRKLCQICMKTAGSQQHQSL